MLTYRDENGNEFVGYDEADLQENIELGLVYTYCTGPGFCCGMPTLGKINEAHAYCDECDEANQNRNA